MISHNSLSLSPVWYLSVAAHASSCCCYSSNAKDLKFSRKKKSDLSLYLHFPCYVSGGFTDLERVGVGLCVCVCVCGVGDGCRSNSGSKLFQFHGEIKKKWQVKCNMLTPLDGFEPPS